MCFSSTASFIAGSVLAVAGAASLRVIHHTDQRPLAMIPFIFSIQQFLEGFLWMAHTNHSYSDWEMPFTYSFLFFAQVIWPFWVPFAFYKEEQNSNHKKILKGLLYAGCLSSLYLLFCLLRFPVHSNVISGHMQYTLSFPEYPSLFIQFVYFIATVMPPFIASKKKRSAIGSLLFISFAVTFLFFPDYLISVWCYFAALISITVYLVLQDEFKNVLYKKVVPE
ncbi:MAG: hypothetical protein IPJ86_14630 [Bacteroidetes bacterium]|nr:hypothetical protein [Bacteroidota bacterium]MBK9317450.1 hypothetical protein [Bacteroidota bacterium]